MTALNLNILKTNEDSDDHNYLARHARRQNLLLGKCLLIMLSFESASNYIIIIVYCRSNQFDFCVFSLLDYSFSLKEVNAKLNIFLNSRNRRNLSLFFMFCRNHKGFVKTLNVKQFTKPLTYFSLIKQHGLLTDEVSL